MKTLNIDEIKIMSGAGLLSGIEAGFSDVSNGLQETVKDTGSAVSNATSTAASILEQAHGLGVQSIDYLRRTVSLFTP